VRVPPLPLAAGVLLALSMPPFPFGALSFVALAPFAVWVAGLPAGAEGRDQAMRGGIWFGAGFFTVLLHWVAFSLLSGPLMGIVACAAMVAGLCLFPAAAGWLFHRLVFGGAPVWLALPVVWTATEWLRGHFPGGLAFPWGGLALSLTRLPDWLALARWTGEYGVAFWIALVNGLVAEAFLRWRARTSEGRASVPGELRRSHGAGAAPLLVVVGLVVAALPVALSAFPGAVSRADAAGRPSVAVPDSLRVALVQTALSVETRRDPVRGAEVMARALERLLSTVPSGTVDLVVLPETAFLLPLELPEGEPYLSALRVHSARLGAPLLVGALGVDAGGARRASTNVYNSVFHVDSSGIRARYDKRRLVPGVERTPLLPTRVLAALNDTASYAAGGRQQPLGVGGGTLVGVLVCFESAFAPLARRSASAGAGLLVNVTNDAWFGDGPPGGAARAQHGAHLVLRAIETGVVVVRSANGGASMAVDAAGRVDRTVPAGQEGVHLVTVPADRGDTPFVRLGEVVGKASTGAAALLLMWILIGERRRDPGRDPSRAGAPMGRFGRTPDGRSGGAGRPDTTRAP